MAATRATAAGEAVISSHIAGDLLSRIRERDMPVRASSENAATAIRAVLTERELEIFKLLASGESTQEIGCQLALSTNTVSNHIASILAKLRLDNRRQFRRTQVTAASTENGHFRGPYRPFAVLLGPRWVTVA